MPRRLKGKISFKAHEANGVELAEMQNLLAGIETQVGDHYGQASKLTKLADKSSRAIAALRYEYDNQLGRDYPERFDAHVYYPNKEREQWTKQQ